MSDPNGNTRPVGPPERRQQLEEGSLGEAPSSATIYPAPPDPAEVAGVNTPPILPYLTPDAMLVYCQSRLSGINTQCRDLMTRQEQNGNAQAALGDLLSTLYSHQDGVNGDTKQAVLNAYQKAIDDVGGPTSPLGQKLANDRDTLFGTGDTQGDKNAMAALINATKTHQSDLNSDSEIDMIRLQSLMSQRQTAIQLTTNIVQSLNDQANKIVANIGH
jgi:hypothetical protein